MKSLFWALACETRSTLETSSAITIVRLRLLEQILDRDQWTNIEPELKFADAGMMNLPISTLMQRNVAL